MSETSRRLPMVVPDADLPDRVTVYEVGPRDGLQNEQRTVPVDVKVELVERLVAAGLPVVEVTSFVSPRWVPQLADPEELLAALAGGPAGDGIPMPVLVPNHRGLDRALALGVRRIAVFASATGSFARRDLNRWLE